MSEPLTPAEWASDPDAFVAGMSVTNLHTIFVPIPPYVLRAMIGDDPLIDVQPYCMGTRQGSTVSSTDEAKIAALRTRFHRPLLSPPDDHDLGGEG